MAGDPDDGGVDGGEAGPATGRNRHLDGPGLDYYLNSGAPAGIKLDGDPLIYLIVDPTKPSLSLRTPSGPKHVVPDLAEYRNIKATTIHWSDRPWCDVTVEGPFLREAYPLLCSIADRIQLQAQAFTPAVRQALDSFHGILAGAPALSEQQQTGLFGELLVLRQVVLHSGSKAAVASWRGPGSEEHDFDVDGNDIEVKSTVAEVRQHWIASLQQLAPTADRPLWMVSIQLTGAGAGGHTLPELVAAITQLLAADSAIESFQRKLHEAGWRDSASAQYSRRLRLRSAPEIYQVGAGFPALTSTHLSAAVDQSRLVQVQYMINLSGLAPSAAPPSFLTNMNIGAAGD